MNQERDAVLLRIFMKEADKWQGKPLHSAILEEAHKAGLAGATAVHAIAGYGSSNEPRHLLELPSDPSVVVEIVDWEDRAEAFVEKISEMMERGLVTTEKVRVLWYRSKRDD
jgi:PII-like signaling protein